MDGITDPMDMSLSKLGEIVKDRDAWHELECLYVTQMKSSPITHLKGTWGKAPCYSTRKGIISLN